LLGLWVRGKANRRARFLSPCWYGRPARIVAKVGALVELVAVVGSDLVGLTCRDTGQRIKDKGIVNCLLKGGNDKKSLVFVLQLYYICVTIVLQMYYNCITIVLQMCYKCVTNESKKNNTQKHKV